MNKVENHRFYYSQEQRQVIETIRCLDEEDDGKSCFVKLDDGTLAMYTEWCSMPDSKCNWRDAVLVTEIKATKNDIFKRIVRA